MSNEREAVITAPKFETAELHITGTAPMVQHRFWKKGEIMKTQMEGKTGKRSKKAPRDFEADYQKSAHKAVAGWYGIPASSFRNAMISACRLVGFKMTFAKLSVWVDQDGFDEDGYPLVRLTSGEPRRHDAYVRNQTGVIDIRSRAMFDSWTATLRVKFDADQFTITDVVNLLARAGGQVGIGEGRPDSKESAGMGWGTFRILSHEEIMRGAAMLPEIKEELASLEAEGLKQAPGVMGLHVGYERFGAIADLDYFQELRAGMGFPPRGAANVA